MSSPQLTVIIPFRNDPASPYLIIRLEELIKSFPKKTEIEFILADSGSDIKSQQMVSELCKANNVKYLYHDSSNQVFSIGEARDYGVVHANGKNITFMDVDFRVPFNFWERLLCFMRQFEINEKKKSIFTVPTLYLTQQGTEEFTKIDNDDKYNQFLLKWLYGDESLVQTMAFCSPTVIIDRYYFLSIGGHNPEFRGHGFEDFELYHRILTENNEFPHPDNYYLDKKSWNFSTYSGFRAKFSLLGRAAYAANLFTVHLWHPRSGQASFYNSSAMKRNRSIWQPVFKKFEKTREHPEPLIAKNSLYKKILIFGKPKTNIMNCMRGAMPIIGSPLYVNEFDFIEENEALKEEELRQLLDYNNVDLILFTAPYRNKAIRNIYEWCRKENFPYLVFERGALPDSWFFDSKGFNADSPTYDEKYWNFDLDEEKTKFVKDYIYSCFNEREPLEAQNSRIGAMGLADKLKIGGKKVLFVPLQRPSDMVIKFMSGAALSFDNFAQVIDKTAQEMKKYGWVVVCKKHPLETVSPELSHALYAPDDTNFLDLIELSDSVCLINSGVGVYAMMAQKPCYILGEAFYQINGVNVSLNNCDPRVISDAILKGYQLDTTKMYKFIYYLLEHVYSFGSSTVTRRTEKDGSLRTITHYVDYYHININNKFIMKYKYNQSKLVPPYAPLLEAYKLDILQRKQSNQNKTIENKNTAASREEYTQETSYSYKLLLFFVKPFMREKKYNKLRYKPYKFFDDTNSSIVKAIGKVVLK